MHDDLASRFVHGGVVHGDMEAVKDGHDGMEVGGVLFVVERWAVEGGGTDVVEAGGGAKGEDGCGGPGVVGLDDLLGGGEEDLAGDGGDGGGCCRVIDLISM